MRREVAAEVRAEQERVSHEERIARLEDAAGFSPSEAQTLSREVMAEMWKQGEVISEAKEQLIAELSSIAPALIRTRVGCISVASCTIYAVYDATLMRYACF